jgi:DNA-binding response OmpR family regulator
MNPLTALVIDDDKMLALGFSIALQQSGFTVEKCTDGTQAMEEIERLRPAVVTLDVHMPHISGIDILRAIRSHPHLIDTKVIVVTAAGTVANSDIVNTLADLVLLKPISLSQLTSLATRFAEQQRGLSSTTN